MPHLFECAVLSCLILCRLVLSFLRLSCVVLSCRVLYCFVLCCVVVSFLCPFLSCLVLVWLVVYSLLLSFLRFLSCLVLPFFLCCLAYGCPLLAVYYPENGKHVYFKGAYLHGCPHEMSSVSLGLLHVFSILLSVPNRRQKTYKKQAINKYCHKT